MTRSKHVMVAAVIALAALASVACLDEAALAWACRTRARDGADRAMVPTSWWVAGRSTRSSAHTSAGPGSRMDPS